MRNIEEYEAMAMLSLPPGERDEIRSIAEDITAGFAALETIGADGAEPLVSPLGLSNIMREDISSKLCSRDEILENAPARHEGYFGVPGTFE